MSLPIIHIGSTDDGLDELAARIDAAASEFGFFYVTGHGVAEQEIQRLLDLSREFFAQPLEIKDRVSMSRGGRAWRGFFPVGGELTSGRPDLKEGLYFGEELGEDDNRVRAGWPLHGRNLVPDLPGFREALLRYMSALTDVSHRLMSLIARGLNVGDDYFAMRYTGRPTTLFRIFHYPAAAPDKDEKGVGEHTDYGLITLLYQDEIGGLQVKHGDTWLEVPYVPGSFVVNIGDMLERLTAGRYTSALHRVINRSGRSRMSMPFFFDPAFDAQLRPIEGVAPRPGQRVRTERWDGLDLRELRGTYGEYLIGKVSKVFPELGRDYLSARPVGAGGTKLR